MKNFYVLQNKTGHFIGTRIEGRLPKMVDAATRFDSISEALKFFRLHGEKFKDDYKLMRVTIVPQTKQTVRIIPFIDSRKHLKKGEYLGYALYGIEGGCFMKDNIWSGSDTLEGTQTFDVLAAANDFIREREARGTNEGLYLVVTVAIGIEVTKDDYQLTEVK